MTQAGEKCRSGVMTHYFMLTHACASLQLGKYIFRYDVVEGAPSTAQGGSRSDTCCEVSNTWYVCAIVILEDTLQTHKELQFIRIRRKFDVFPYKGVLS